MTKTLADMTAEEREDCVGMWALIEGINLAVIAEADGTNTCVVVYPQWNGGSTVYLNKMVTPRFDLPRAWTPDGEPELAQALAEETWEYQVQTRSQRMPTWSAITDDTLQKWYPEDKYNDLTHTGRIVRGGAGFEIRVLRRRVSPPEVCE